MASMNPGLLSGLTYGTSMSKKPDITQYEDETADMTKLSKRNLPLEREEIIGNYQGQFEPDEQFYASQYMPLSDYKHDSAAYDAAKDAASGHYGMINANTNPDANGRYQELAMRREEILKQIQDLTADISYQKKLKALEYTNDPLWEQAKYKFIYHNDSSGLENILGRVEAEKTRKFNESENKLNRASTEKIAQEGRDQTRQEQKEANARSARFSRNVLSELLKTYESVKEDPTKQIEAGNNLIRQLQDVKEKAEIAGLTMEELYSEMPEELEAVNLAIEEARLTAKTNIEESKKKAEQDKQQEADAKIAQAERNAVSNAVAEFNKVARDYKTATEQKKTFEKDHPGFIFSLAKGKSGGWTIDYKEKAK